MRVVDEAHKKKDDGDINTTNKTKDEHSISGIFLLFHTKQGSRISLGG